MTAKSELSTEQLRSALEILRTELKAIALTRKERVACRMLTVLGLVIIPPLVIVIIALALTDILGFVQVDRLTRYFPVIVGILLTVPTVALLAVLPWTLPIFVKAIRQWWIMRRSKLNEQFEEMSTRGRLEQRLRTYSTLAFALLSIGFCAFALPKSRPTGAHDPGSLALWINVVFFLAPGFAWIAWRCQQRLELLSDLTSLRALFREATAIDEIKQGRATLPSEAFTRVVRIERAQIVRDRSEALYEARAEATSGYAVLKTVAVQQVLRAMNIATRLRVEDCIQELMHDMESVERQPGHPRNVFRRPIPGTPLTLLYEVDEPRERITVLAIDGCRPLSSNPDFTGTFHG